MKRFTPPLFVKLFLYIIILSFTSCVSEVLDSDSKEILSCESCKNESDVLIKTENGAQFCSEPIGELEGCIKLLQILHIVIFYIIVHNAH